ncbi:DsrE family protein [Helicobacter anatolicus]|uniref:DsrE family protein n=1 Tax=Helicobacter anatolicus TaxID=2905874 RepID=UPI001E48BB99|nr:DsrE family protein [Helicobacter anatolicus]MCE3038072.1 hypothetical protein [Helicobacter anatolicus]MCE3039438.1 hypothetical protein [Helicobacter anatolicus]
MQKVILMKGDKIGEGELGKMVGAGFIQAICMQCEKNQNLLPKAIVFLNNSVLFGLEETNKEVFAALKKLESMGVELEFCETCLNYFNIKDKLAVGRINHAMYISELLLSAEVLSL